MEGHMHEHGPLYTSVPRVMFDEGGWVGGGVLCWCCVVSVCPSSGQTHHTSTPTVFASLMIRDNMYVQKIFFDFIFICKCICVCVCVHSVILKVV